MCPYYWGWGGENKCVHNTDGGERSERENKCVRNICTFGRNIIGKEVVRVAQTFGLKKK